MSTAPFVLRSERMNRGLTVAALADLLDVSRHTIMRIEAGARPNAPVALKIALWLSIGGEPVRVTDLWPVAPTEATGEGVAA
jgi:DNA-binding XRE family transcriptional regulator